jgi:tetratricopeptide (TPR) repeat protein
MSSKILQWVGLIDVAATVPLVFTVISNSIKSAGSDINLDRESTISSDSNKTFNNRELADYNRAIQIDPITTSGYVSRGIMKAVKLNDTPGALTDYNRAIQINPNLAEAYSNRSG